MLLAIYILIILTLLILSFADVKLGKINITRALNRFLILLTLTFTLYLYYWSTNAIDSASYLTSFGYVGSLKFTTDILYYGFVAIVKRIGGDYQVLRLVIGAFYLLPIMWIAKTKKESLNVPLFILLSLLFPFFQNMVALKNTLAATVSVFAFWIYFDSNKRPLVVWITYALLFVASLFHDTAIVYILIFSLMLLMRKISDLRRSYYMLFGVAVILIIVIRSGIATNVLSRLAGETNQAYISRIGSIGYGFLLITMLQILVFVLFYKKVRNNEIENGPDELSNSIMLLFYATIVLIPLYSINVLFFRLFRNIMVFGYLIYSNNGRKNRRGILLLVILLIILMLYDANGIGTIQSILFNTAK